MLQCLCTCRSVITHEQWYMISWFVHAVCLQTAKMLLLALSQSNTVDFNCREVNNSLSHVFKLQGLQGMDVFMLHIYHHSTGNKSWLRFQEPFKRYDWKPDLRKIFSQDYRTRIFLELLELFFLSDIARKMVQKNTKCSLHYQGK